MAPQISKSQRVLFMLGLIIAGEAIFSLPFHVGRFFRPTFLSVFGITNTELGEAQAVYGVTAMVAYLLGGPLADQFSARKLLAASLVGTSLGGVYLSTIPSAAGLKVVFGYWGFSTILLFWAALIRATRDWGGDDQQGQAYGILDGGRGVLAAGMASAAVALFALFFPEDPEAVSDAQRLSALRYVIYAYTGVTFGAAALVWFVIPDHAPDPDEARQKPQGPALDVRLRAVVHSVLSVLKFPAVWLHAAIVVCAYVSYKGMDNYSLFAADAYKMNEVDAAGVSALGNWMRPLAAVAAGFLGDRFRSSRVIIASFAALLVSHLFFALDTPNPSVTSVLFANIIASCVFIFAIRGVYFALFEEASVPPAVTGTAVGIVSVVGYTPDIFVSLVAGILIDRTPGVEGHQHFFFFLAGWTALGLVASLWFRRFAK